MKLLKKYGKIAVSKVHLLVRCGAIHTLVKGYHQKMQLSHVQAADVAWAWVAEEQTQGRLLHLTTTQASGQASGQARVVAGPLAGLLAGPC